MNENEVQVYVSCSEDNSGAENQVADCTSHREFNKDGYGELQDKLKNLETELTEIKFQRKEDARANEKVACMFATQEQNWIAEKKSLQRQIQALFAQFRVIELKKEEMISSLKKNIEEKDQEILLKREEVDELINKNRALEEKVQKAAGFVEELNTRLTKEAEDHSCEILKHKTAVAELVSNQRKMEADMGRALRQVESMKLELDEAIQQKYNATETVERLSGEIARLCKDGEQKNKILSAMLRKSKHDTTEKQMLLKEVKMSKLRRKQAELEAEQWRAACETRRKKGCRVANSFEPGCSYEKSNKLQLNKNGAYSRALLLEYLESESRKDREHTFQKEGDICFRNQCFERHSYEDDEFVMIDIKQLQDWIHTETEKYATVLEQRHYAEIEAFTEQMRVKDEKLEGLHWKFLSAELEVKHKQSHIYDLEANLSQLQDEKNKLDSLLLNKEMELKSINDRFTSHVLNCPKNKKPWGCSGLLDPLTLSSDVKITRIPREQVQEVDRFVEEPANVEKQRLSVPQHEEVQNYTDITTTFSTTLSHSHDHTDVIPVMLGVDGDPEEIGEEKEVSVDPGRISKPLDSRRQNLIRNSSWKVDINAMGVSFKIKRLEQQLRVVEKLTAKDSVSKTDKCDKRTVEKKHPLKGFHHLMSLLNKQVKRYQSLEEKANDLCKRMSEDERIIKTRDASNDERTCEQVKTLEHFLEETFQLQRFMVATGQKLMEIQSRITCSFMNADGKLDKSAGFNMGQFADIVRCLLREIQRGLEVRISRIIGDLEGILARDVIKRF